MKIKNPFSPKFDITRAFDRDYRNDFESGSGRGSLPQNNAEYCAVLLSLLRTLPVREVIDYGCGNLETYRGHIEWHKTPYQYVGIDCSPSLIPQLQARYPLLSFHHVPAFEDAPVIHGDVIIVKDVFIHWYDHQIAWFADTILPRFKYGIFTHENDIEDYDDPRSNNKWRPVVHANFFHVLEEQNVRVDHLKQVALVNGSLDAAARQANIRQRNWLASLIARICRREPATTATASPNTHPMPPHSSAPKD